MPRFAWSQVLKQVYQRFPAAIRSKDWPEIVKAADAGDKARALELARAHEDRSKTIRAENVVARRMRLARVAVFALRDQAGKDLEGILKEISAPLLVMIRENVDDESTASDFAPEIRKMSSAIRRELKKWLTDAIWQTILLTLRNVNDSLGPVFKENQESFGQDLQESVDLQEDRLSFGLSAKLAGSAKLVKLTSDKWQSKAERVYTRVTTERLKGLDLADSVWQIANQAEAAVRRILTGEIAKGTSARDLAKKVQRYLSPEILRGEGGFGPGIYRSPFKNAMRLARTSISQSYASTTAEFASDRPWVKGLRATLSPAHKLADECDDNAGKIFSPDDFEATYPLHPHCMCFGVYVIDEKYLKDGE